MDFDMKKWIQDMIRADVKKPLPVLSFPGIQITGNTVEEIVGNGTLQADCMEAVAKKFDMAAVLSLMDLSVEAEAFGSPVRYSAEEVPTVTAPIIHDEDEAEALRVPEVGEGRTGECLKGIREIAGRVKDRPILAGMIGPYSLAGRLLDMTEIMILCYEDPGAGGDCAREGDTVPVRLCEGVQGGGRRWDRPRRAGGRTARAGTFQRFLCALRETDL